MTQVIYKIINLVNDKFYVGSTVHKKVRFRQHRKLLRGSRHHCARLQAAWNKYGEEKFAFVVVEEVPEGASLQAAEDVWLQEHVGKGYCYNTGRSADAPWRGVYGAANPKFGIPRTQEEKRLIGKSLRAFYAEDYNNHPRVGTVHTPEARAKISSAKLANPQRYWEGKERSQETKDKISAAQVGVAKPGRKVSAEGLAKIRANIEAGRSHQHWKGRTHTDEAKEKMRKRVTATSPEGVETVFDSLTATLEALALLMPTLNRALKSGAPLSRGPRKGWSFRYTVDTEKSA